MSGEEILGRRLLSLSRGLAQRPPFPVFSDSDEAIGFALQKGVIVSRAYVKYFKHNDMEDLERVLKSIQEQDKKTKSKLNRRFIVTEGLFQNTGDICPLPNLVSRISENGTPSVVC